MAIDLAALAPITTAATSLSNLVLASPQATIGYQPTPMSSSTIGPAAPGALGVNLPPAFMFHYEGEQRVELKSDITDHYVEDNTAVEDQIALHPERIMTHGFIGELNNVPPPALAAVQEAADKLTTIGAYTPGLTTTAELAYAEAFAAYQVTANAANAGIAAWTSIASDGTNQAVIGSDGLFIDDDNSPFSTQSRQQAAFAQWYGWWRSRTLFTVQTPWAVFQNMAIEDLTPVQEGETNVLTDFTVTFKMIRFASTQTTFPTISTGATAAQSASQNNLGTGVLTTGGPSQSSANASMGATV